MKKMLYTDVWELEVKRSKQKYRHTFLFTSPPSLDDFLALCKGLPWTFAAWGETLLPWLRENPAVWPIVEPGYKAAHADLIEPTYSITICRSRVYLNS